MTPEAARELTDRIRARSGTVVDLLSRACEQRAWEALGYASAPQWRRAEFGDEPLVSPGALVEVQRRLRAGGATYQRIADVTGTSTDTAWRNARTVHGRTPIENARGQRRPESYRPHRATVVRRPGRVSREWARWERQVIREWARRQGMAVSETGRLPADVIDAYDTESGAVVHRSFAGLATAIAIRRWLG